MKNVAAVLLVAVAIAYYMGYEPWELIPSSSWFSSSTPPPKVRRAAPPPPADQAPAVQPQRTSSATVTAGRPDDGSLEHRWTSTNSPTKP